MGVSERRADMSEWVKSRTRDHVMRVTIDRPDLHNAFDEAVIEGLRAAFAAAGDDPEAGVVVLESRGRSFCAGADVRWMKRMIGYSFEENVADTLAMAVMLETIRDCPKPVIARVHGAAFGGGVGLIAACDVAVSVAGAVFCLSEVRLGICPAVISPFVLGKVAAGPARRYALTAERFDAAEAHRIGLVDEVVEDEQRLDERIGEIIRAILGNGPEAMAETKKLLREVPRLSPEEARRYTADITAHRRISPEGQQGLQAFLEKGRPAWRVGD